MENIYFAKIKKNAKIPTKREEDGAHDIYPCFDEPSIMIMPFESKLIPTGIASAFSDNYVAVFRERGSTGIKNIKINAGVVDSGYRDEWFVLIYNGNKVPLCIAKNPDKIEKHFTKGSIVCYPYKKAIAQMLLLPVPKVNIVEKTYDEIKNIKSERGMGKLGSSRK